jgi:hypothetical protein
MRKHDDEPQGDSPPIAAPDLGRDSSSAVLLVATAAFLISYLPLIPRRIFDPDEFEHAHAAWCWWKGMIPYKDFFEHHTPWYYAALRPLFRWFDVDASFESARHFLLLGRVLSFALTVLSVFLVNRIGRFWEGRQGGQSGRQVGALAGLLLVGQAYFLQKAIETRPDVLALPFFLGALWCLLRGLAESTDSAARRLWCFVGGGLSLGAAIMCTQKILFVLPGLFAGLGIWALSAHRRARTLLVGAFVLGMLVPGVLTWAAFVRQHAGGEFIANNFLLNSRWKHVETNLLRPFIKSARLVLILSVLGLLGTLRRFFVSLFGPFFGPRERGYGELVLLCTLLGLCAGVRIIPAAQKQYYLMPLPLICLFAAAGLLWLVDWLGSLRRAPRTARAWLLVLAVGVLLKVPVQAVRFSYRERNDLQLARLRHVFETTKPTDLVMDGWEGTGVFRPHAFYYYFVHEELLPMLSRDRLDAYVDDLESGRIQPKLITLDANLVALEPRFLRFVMNRYVSRDGVLYYPRD